MLHQMSCYLQDFVPMLLLAGFRMIILLYAVNGTDYHYVLVALPEPIISL
jgi:hypothetical protein